MAGRRADRIQTGSAMRSSYKRRLFFSKHTSLEALPMVQQDYRDMLNKKKKRISDPHARSAAVAILLLNAEYTH